MLKIQIRVYTQIPSRNKAFCVNTENSSRKDDIQMNHNLNHNELVLMHQWPETQPCFKEDVIYQENNFLNREDSWELNYEGKIK